VKRREFVAGLAGAMAWPMAACAQQGDRVRRIGTLMPNEEDDLVEDTYLSAFTRRLPALGWTEGRDIRIDLRWAAGDLDRMQILARELVALHPDMIVA
jgi:putative tryptophan/tyrosine transport system substrate-binding protein